MKMLGMVLGYTVNSLLILIIIFSGLRIWLEVRRARSGKEIHLGPLTEEISDLIVSHTGKIIPLKKKRSLLTAAIAISFLLIYIVYRVLI